jgi:uncharacterized protein (TIGR03083 family)
VRHGWDVWPGVRGTRPERPTAGQVAGLGERLAPDRRDTHDCGYPRTDDRSHAYERAIRPTVERAAAITPISRTRARVTPVDLFAEIADERRGLATLLSGLTVEQQAKQSLCSEWSVHDVLAHLVVPLEVGLPTFVRAMLVSRGNFDRANVRLTREQARRPFGELVEVLRRRADSRFTPPGGGPEAPLTDLLVHGLDIRWPLRLSRDTPGERLRTALTYLTAGSAGGFVPRGALGGLRFEADDVDWVHGSGPVVRGDAEALLLAITGRTVALGHLSGDGVPTLRSRLG